MYACKLKSKKIAMVLMQKSTELEIDLNAKDIHELTAFHWACVNSETSIVEMMIENAKIYNLDLEAKDECGKSGYDLASINTINLIKQKFPSIYLLHAK